MAVFNEVVRINDTSALLIPVGTSIQQPSGKAGLIRFNSDTGSYEGYATGSWKAIGGQYTTTVALSGATVVFTPAVGTTSYELFGTISNGPNKQTLKIMAGVDNSVWDYTIYSVNNLNLSYAASIDSVTGVFSINMSGSISFKSTEI